MIVKQNCLGGGGLIIFCFQKGLNREITVWSEIFGLPTGEKSEVKHGGHGGPEFRRLQSPYAVLT